MKEEMIKQIDWIISCIDHLCYINPELIVNIDGDDLPIMIAELVAETEALRNNIKEII